jgi:thioredoxin-like negative regulator of GroEL
VTTSRDTPVLLFFTSVRSGPARRMESLLAQLTRKQRGRLRVVTVDADSSRPLADAFAVADIPTLVLLREGRPVERIEGRVNGPQIDAMIRRHLPNAPDDQDA